MSILRDLIDAASRSDGDAPAILAVGRPVLPYAALLDQIDRTRAFLASVGIGRGDAVALSIPNGPEIAGAFVAIASSAVCAPLNPAYRTSELEFYLSDLQARAVVVPEGQAAAPAAEVARRLGMGVLRIRSAASAAAGSFELVSDGVIPPRTTQELLPEVALALHTSGSTGRPKLVPLTGANLAASARNVSSTLELGKADRCLNVMPLFHIHGLIAAVLSSLAAGASVVCTTGFDPERFFDWLEETGATWYTAVPTIHQAVLQVASRAPQRARSTRLRFIRSSSASLPPAVMAALEESTGVPMLEAYGMTEAAHQMACNPLPPRPRKPGSVGPAAGPEVAILDPDGGMLGPGQLGEISIRGPNVTTGYVRNPDANAGAFTGSWFRTGDQGRMDEDGYVFITGRFKEIINRAGEKITPREIDEILLGHPAVAQVVTFGVPHPSLGEDIAAAVVLRPGETANAAELRSFLLDRVAEYKVPSQIVFLGQLPVGPSGKLQRVGLADRLIDELRRAGAEPPASELEARLCAIWAEVLNVQEVGATDNFFALGGDSLVLVAMSVRAEQDLLRFSAEDVTRWPTVRELAPHVRPVDAPAEPTGPPPVAASTIDLGAISVAHPERIERAFGVTLTQSRFLKDYTRGGRTIRVNCVCSISLTGNLDLEVLRGVWRQLVQRHGVLRAAFAVSRDAGDVNLVYRDAELPWAEHDLRGLAAGAETAAVDDAIRAEMSRGYLVADAPLFAASILRLDDDRHELLLSFWHGVADGWSASILIEEMMALYRAAMEGTQAALRPPVGFEPLVQYLAGRDQEQADEYWRAHLEGFRGPNRIFPPEWTMSGWIEAAEQYRAADAVWSEDETRRIRTWARRHNLSLNATLQGAWALLVGAASGDDDVVYNSAVAGRRLPVPGIERIVCLLADALPMRVRISHGPVAEWLVGVQAVLAEHSRYEWSSPFLRLGRYGLVLPPGHSVCQTSFNFLGGHQAWFGGQMADVKVSNIRSHYNSYRVRLDVYPSSMTTLLRLAYDERGLRADQARAMVDGYKAMVDALVAGKATSIEELRAVGSHAIFPVGG